MLNTGLVVVLICLSTTFTSEFMICEFDGGPLYLIDNSHKILWQWKCDNSLSKKSLEANKDFIIIIGLLFIENSIYTWWTNTHNSSIMHDAYRTFANVTFSFMKTIIKNTQNSLRLDWDYGKACDLNSSVNMHSIYPSTRHFTCSSHAWIVFHVCYRLSI